MSGASPRLRLALVCLLAMMGPGGVSSQGPDPLDSIRTLIREARFAQAESAARALLSETEQRSGSDSPEAAAVADVLVESLWRGGKVRAPETRALAERAVAIREARLGTRHPDVGHSLTSLALVLRQLGDQAGARALVDRALVLQQEALGQDHLEVARTLTASAAVAVDTGDLPGARALQERALEIRRQRLPGADPAIGENLNGLGLILERQGDTAGAERYYQQALAIREAALGPGHPDVALSLNNLGNIQSDRGNYAEARSLHERALAIREKSLGPRHPDVAMSLNNLAVAVRDLGDHAAAWFLLERVLVIWEQVFGPAHQNIGIVCHNLGAILVDLGDEAGARLLAERARRVQRGGADAAALSERLNSVLGAAPPPGGSRGARALFELALAIKEKALGPNHTSVGLTLTSLANAHRQLGEPARATPLYERALAIQQKAYGPKHPDAADTLDRLGEALAEAGEYAAARSTFERVLAILEELQGPDHPHVGVVRQHLAELLGLMGDAPAALRLALDAERIGRDHFRLVGRTLPEREALQYAAMRPMGLDVALSVLGRGGAAPESATAAVWDAVVRSRALVLDEMASRRRTLGQSDQPDVAARIADLAAAREQLARLAVQGSGGAPAAYFEALAKARAVRDAAERALAERSLAFRVEQRQQRLGLEDVRAAVPPGSALVAFVRHAQHAIAVQSSMTPPPRPAAAYLAFVLRAGADPVSIPLGPADDLEADIARWRKQVTAVVFAGGRSTARAEAAARDAGAALRRRLWDPIAPAVAGAARVFIVPDGPLHLVSWEALPAARGYLIEAGPLLHYLSAERDLVRGEDSASGRGLLVVDSPIFDDSPGRSARAADPAAPPPAGSPAVSFRGPRSGCGDFQSIRFDPLPASAREAASLATIWRRGPSGAAPDRAGSIAPAAADPGLVRLSGRAATEAAVKQGAAGTRVLHLATHGFFLGGICAPALPASARARAHDAAAGLDPGENPLLLAGFALTGANRRQAAGADQEDGILTAEEIAALDLRGVEWAVLSACDTGVGETRAGEGVFGLRRAFQVAGARTVIMSLWPVEDEDTRRWMTSLYERRFARGLDTMTAVQQSTREQLRRRREAGLSTHPFHWAGFIAAGDWK